MADDFAEAARALRDAADGGFRREVEAELKKVQERIAADMKDAIPGALPRSGGLAEQAAATTSFDVSARGTGDRIEGTITARSKYNLARMNASGSFSHPVYGSETWVSQTEGVRQGFLDEPFRKGEPDLRDAADEAVKNTRATIDRRVR